MHKKIPIIKVVISTFSQRWENTASAMMAMAMFQEKWGIPRFAVFPTTVAKNAKHDLLFVDPEVFGRDSFIWDGSWYLKKTQRVFHNSLCGQFSLLWCGSDLFVLMFFFFRGHFSFDFSKQIGYIAPYRFVWDPQHRFGWGTKPKSLSSDQSTLVLFAAFWGSWNPTHLYGDYITHSSKKKYICI